MKNQMLDLVEILKPYENKWVALTLDNTRVVESGKSLKELFIKLADKDIGKLEFLKVPEFEVGYAPQTK